VRKDAPADAEDPLSPRPRRLDDWPRPTADSLTAENLLRPRRFRPRGGWRRRVYVATAGLVNPGPSQQEVRARELRARARAPVRGCHRVAVISLKGGVGKTTTTVALGAVLASLRGDRVAAVDASPDRGTLADKVEREHDATVRDLVRARRRISDYDDVRAFTSRTDTGLEVLVSPRDPGTAVPFSDAEYGATVGILERFYNVVVTDCGPGLLHSAMKGVLTHADSLVVLSSPALDGARSASATLDWLEEHGYGDLVQRSVAVISMIRPRSQIDLERLHDHFAARCRAVEQIPYDQHLETGGVVDLDRLRPETGEAFLRLAAAVADGFGTQRRHPWRGR
jgi:MinD-like ATPase involved in chromosome partitioning or flagellar assembly